MKKNRLGNSDLFVTEIGFGCMTIGIDINQGIRLLHEAMDRGINYFDTADLYDRGRNEEIVGAALQARRQDVVLATKVGNRWRPGADTWSWDPSKRYIKEAVKSSLKRLRTDYIDLYQLHGGTLEDPIDETIEAFEELVREGIIRYYGISSNRPNVIREYANRSNAISVLTQYSILDRRPEEEVLPLLETKNISVIARGPIAKGCLSGRTGKFEKGYLDYSLEEIQAILSQLRTLTDDSRSLAQVALRYVLSNSTVATIIQGASSIDQLIENLGAEHTSITMSEVQWIQDHSKRNIYQAHR